MRRLCLIALCLLSILALAGCGDDPRPDLRHLYEMGEVNAEQPPLIVIPGILGSKLRDAKTGRPLWPGPAWKLFFSNYRDLALEIDPLMLEPMPSDIEAYDISEEGLGADFYGQLVMTLEDYGGYVRGTPGQKVSTRGRRYYLFPYDWRQDNVVSARRLDALIEQIRKDYDDPELKVDIVAHSMGGLITRYYLRYGTRDVLDGNDFPVSGHGESRIRTVILLGTPNLGSTRSLHTFLRGARIVFGRVPSEVLATMPSMYQL
ncbi:MAG: lipase/acyltransferase domain-containing protein, partial [Nevskiales bacterium]